MNRYITHYMYLYDYDPTTGQYHCFQEQYRGNPYSGMSLVGTRYLYSAPCDSYEHMRSLANRGV